MRIFDVCFYIGYTEYHNTILCDSYDDAYGFIAEVARGYDLDIDPLAVAWVSCEGESDL